MKNINIHNEANINAEGKLNSKHCKPIVCTAVDGSEFRSFSSVADAAAELGINPNYISACMSKNKVCKGYKFCPTKDIVSIVNEMANIINNNAAAARKWREQEAEKEMTRLAEEKRLANIEKAKAKVAKHKANCERFESKLTEEEKLLMQAEIELENLLGEEAQQVA